MVKTWHLSPAMSLLPHAQGLQMTGALLSQLQEGLFGDLALDLCRDQSHTYLFSCQWLTILSRLDQAGLSLGAIWEKKSR